MLGYRRYSARILVLMGVDVVHERLKNELDMVHVDGLNRTS